MKKNKLLLLSLLASTLLVGCDKTTQIPNGDDKVVSDFTGTDKDGNKVDLTVDLNLQKLYENLKTSAGGAKAIEVILEKIAHYEYLGNSESNIEVGFGGEKFNVKNYHTSTAFKADIAEVFEDVVDGKAYLDDDGKFDPESYKEYVEETLDYEVAGVEVTSKYLSTELQNKLGYNYDNYIEEEIIPNLLQQYVYIDYVTSSSKYESYFKSQYSINLEVLKIAHDTTKLNGAWNEALIRDVQAVTGNTHKENYTFATTDYSFVTFNSDNQMVLFETTANGLSYNVYPNAGTDTDPVQALINKMYSTNSANPANIKQITVAEAKTVAASLTAVESFEINKDTVANETYYKNIEQVLIARKLWQIDREVVLAKNYDYKTPLYNAWTESEKNEAKGFAETYSSSNSKPMKQVAKEKKISAQQEKYYTEADYYTKGNYTSVLPTALSSLRGTNAQTLQNNLKSFGTDSKYLLPNKDTLTNPVYLDTASNTYYVCEVNDWYGLYLNGADYGENVKNVSKSDYHIDAYKEGSYVTYTYDASKKELVASEPIVFAVKGEEAFEEIVGLIEVAAESILTDTIKKEAIVALFEKYELEINDQEIYDYISAQYPDYFETEE